MIDKTSKTETTIDLDHLNNNNNNNNIITRLLEQNVKTPKFSLRGEQFIAKCVKCYDADTIHVVICVNNIFSRFCCRLLEIDTAEIRSKNKSEKEYAKMSRDHLRSLILDQLLIIKCQEFDKYGRLLVYLYQLDADTDTDIVNNTKNAFQIGGASNSTRCPDHSRYNWENSLNCQLIEQGHAYRYDGGKKRIFSDWAPSASVHSEPYKIETSA